MFDSGMGDFFRQLPPILIIMFCGSSIALVGVLAMIIGGRGKRARAAEAATAPVPVPMDTTMYNAPPPSGGSGGDLPDLDDLLNVSQTGAAPPPAPVQRGTFSVKTAAGETVEVVSVMTVLRDVADGGLIIQIGDTVFRNPPALADAEFKRRFNSTIRDLYQSISDTSLSTKATGEVTSAATEELPSVSYSPAPAATPPPASTTPPITTGATLPGDLPKFKMPETIEKPKRGRRQPNEPIPEINIANAIEEFLQYKLLTSSQFPGRNIHVRAAPYGGLRIDVDDKSYEAVGDVEDSEVRAFLQTTIEEWQDRQ
jgi:hypothetical protein